MIGPAEGKQVEAWMLNEDQSQGLVRGEEGLLAPVTLPPQLGPRGRKWVGINCWFGMLFQLEAQEAE